MAAQHAIERLSLRVQIAAIDVALTTIQHFERELGTRAVVIRKDEREWLRREVVDVHVEVPRIEIASRPLRCRNKRRRARLALIAEADENRRELRGRARGERTSSLFAPAGGGDGDGNLFEHRSVTPNAKRWPASCSSTKTHETA